MSHSPVFALDNLRCMLRIDGLRREWGWDPVRQPSVRPGTDWGTQSVSWAIIFIIWPFSTVWKSKPPSVMRMLCCTWLLPRGGISWRWTRAQCSWGEMEGGEGGLGGGEGGREGHRLSGWDEHSSQPSEINVTLHSPSGYQWLYVLQSSQSTICSSLTTGRRPFCQQLEELLILCQVIVAG